MCVCILFELNHAGTTMLVIRTVRSFVRQERKTNYKIICLSGTVVKEYFA